MMGTAARLPAVPGAFGDKPEPNHVATINAGERMTSRPLGSATVLVDSEEVIIATLLTINPSALNTCTSLDEANPRGPQGQRDVSWRRKG